MSWLIKGWPILRICSEKVCAIYKFYLQSTARVFFNKLAVCRRQLFGVIFLNFLFTENLRATPLYRVHIYNLLTGTNHSFCWLEQTIHFYRTQRYHFTIFIICLRCLYGKKSHTYANTHNTEDNACGIQQITVSNI